MAAARMMQTDSRTKTTKRIGVFRVYANAPKTAYYTA
jgi:hypothetical protein